MTSAPPANSTPTTPPTSKPPTYPRHGFLLILRWALLLCWTFIVAVFFNGVSAVVNVAENDSNQLSDPATWLGAFLLPKWLLADGAPLALRIAVPAGILLVLIGCIWATRDLVLQARYDHRSVVAEIVDELLPGRVEAPPAPRIAEPDKLPLPATFVGREKEIAQLERDLREGKNAGLFAVRGTGGVGKTALAALIVARLSNDPTFPGRAVWVSCEGRAGDEGLALVWADVARQLGAQDIASEPDPAARRAKLAAELAQRERTLIALDNIEKGLDGDALLDTLSRSGHTAVLITSRQQVAPHRLTSLELEPLEQQDATTLFRDRLRQADGSRPTPDDEDNLPQLLALLGGLPLSVEMTATYAGRQRLPLSEIVREVKEDGLNAEALSFDPKRAPRARFERSWRALTSSQQQTFVGLSVLVGASFPREAALAVRRGRRRQSDRRPGDAGGLLAGRGVTRWAAAAPAPAITRVRGGATGHAARRDAGETW